MAISEFIAVTRMCLPVERAGLVVLEQLRVQLPAGRERRRTIPGIPHPQLVPQQAAGNGNSRTFPVVPRERIRTSAVSA
jgi:hypothetical protein